MYHLISFSLGVAPIIIFWWLNEHFCCSDLRFHTTGHVTQTFCLTVLPTTWPENPSVNLSDSRYAQQLDLGWKSVCGFIWTEMIVQGPLHFYLWYDWNYWCTLLPSCRSSSGIRLYIFYFRSYRVWIRPLHYNYTVNGIGNHGGERVSTCASNHRCCVDDHLV